MPWPEDFHPEIGYLLPSTRIRRIMRVGLLAAGFGLTVGVGGTLAWLSPHGENAITDKNEPASNLTIVEKLPSDVQEVIPAAIATTQDADIKDIPGPVRRFSSIRAQSSHCFDSFPPPNAACSFHRTRQADVAAGPGLGALQAMGKVLDETPRQSERTGKPPVKQSERLKPAAPSDNTHQYASRGLRYHDRASFDRGGFW